MPGVYACRSYRLLFILGYNPDCMNNSRKITEYGENDIDPEMLATSYLKKNAQRWKNYCTDNFYQFHVFLLIWLMV